MYYTKISLVGVTTIDLPIVGASVTDKYILKEVDGLEPPNINVFVANSVNARSVYQARQAQDREIVMRIGLNPDYSGGETVSDLRTALYGILSPVYDQVIIKLMNDADQVAYTVGYVSKFENAIFSKDPEVQITFECPDYFLLGDVVNVTGLNTSTPTIHNDGTAPTGFYLSVTFTANVTNWSLESTETADTMGFDYAFLTNDFLYMNTQGGERSAWLNRGSDPPLNMLPYMTLGFKWLQLHGGDNPFATSDSHITYGDVYYTEKYWGV